MAIGRSDPRWEADTNDMDQEGDIDSAASASASRASSPPTHPLGQQQDEQVDHDSEQAPRSSSTPPSETSARYQWFLPPRNISHHLREAAALVESGLIYDTDHALYDIQFNIEQPASPPSTTAPEGQVIPASSSRASSSAKTLNSQLRSFTEEEFIAAKPHPEALFSPTTMEWVVISPAHELAELACGELGMQTLYLEERPPFPVYITSDMRGSSMKSTIAPPKVVTFVDEGTKRASKLCDEPSLIHLEPLRKEAYCSMRVRSAITIGLLDSILVDRKGNPPPGKTGAEAAQDAFKVLTRIVGNAARDDVRPLPLSSATIQHKLGYDHDMQNLFRCIGLQKHRLDNGNEAFKASEQDQDLTLRNLIEILVFFQHNKPSSDLTLDTEKLGFTFTIKRLLPVDFACTYLGWSREYETNEYESTQHLANNYRSALVRLGVSEAANDEVLRLLYQANLQVQPGKIIKLFSALDVVRREQRPQSEMIQMMYAIEKSKGNRFTEEEVTNAYLQLQIHVNQAKHKLKDSEIYSQYWILTRALEVEDANEKYQKARELQDALRTVCRVRGDPPMLMEALLIPLPMSVSEACEVLGLPEGGSKTDDEGVLTSFQVHMMDDPSKQEQLQQALGIIAQDRKSEVLLRYFQTGEKEEEGLGSSTLPTGLNNIGNTCYLNSVLQYFYALRPLRERVLKVGQSFGSVKVAEDISRRVGGRVVTQNEVDRSEKFVQELAILFDAMMTSPALAVTPERELAYLALVSARAEELDQKPAAVAENVAEKEHQKGSRAVGDDEVLPGYQEEVPHELSILDNASSDHLTRDDASMKDVEIDPSSSGTLTDVRARDPNSQLSAAEEGRTLVRKIESDADAQMREVSPEVTEKHASDDGCAEGLPFKVEENEELPTYSPPPLPPRPTPSAPPMAAQPSKDSRQHSLMSLGAQQDVSECLDNVLFQIEVALDQGQSTLEAEDHNHEDAAEGEILRLFTGKTQQRVDQIKTENDEGIESPVEAVNCTPLGAKRSSSTHVKNEIFTILPVEVREEGRDIYDSLDGFFAEETLTSSDGKIVKRKVTLLEPPPILQIQLQRVQFDRVKGAYKSQAHLETGESIFMDRYLDFTPETVQETERAARLAAKRKEALELRVSAAECRARLAVLKERSSLSGWDVLPDIDFPWKKTDASQGEDTIDASTEEELKSALDDPDLLAALQSERDFILQRETRELEERLALIKAESEALWETERDVEYRLMSVFMHRGEASHGHYFLNQRKVPAAVGDVEKEWFKYNDNVVTEAWAHDVLRDQTGATPYLLCFVRKDMQESHSPLFETVKRRIDDQTS